MAQVILDQVTNLMITCCKLGYFTKKSSAIHNPSLTRPLVREAHNNNSNNKGGTKRIQTEQYANLDRDGFLVPLSSTKILVDTLGKRSTRNRLF